MAAEINIKVSAGKLDNYQIRLTVHSTYRICSSSCLIRSSERNPHVVKFEGIFNVLTLSEKRVKSKFLAKLRPKVKLSKLKVVRSTFHGIPSEYSPIDHILNSHHWQLGDDNNERETFVRA